MRGLKKIFMSMYGTGKSYSGIKKHLTNKNRYLSPSQKGGEVLTHGAAASVAESAGV